MVIKTKNNLLEGYEDLFDEDGANPRDIKHRAEAKIHQIKETKDYTKYLVKQRVKWDKEDLERLNGVIDELKSVLLDKDSPKLKELLSVKIRERKVTRKNIRVQYKMLGIMKKMLVEKMGSHKQILEQVSNTTNKKQVVRDFSKQLIYIG